MPERRKVRNAPLRAIFAQRLREAIKEAGIDDLTMRDQCEVLDVPLSTWIETLNGRRMPTVERVVEYADKLGVKIAFLMGED